MFLNISNGRQLIRRNVKAAKALQARWRKTTPAIRRGDTEDAAALPGPGAVLLKSPASIAHGRQGYEKQATSSYSEQDFRRSGRKFPNRHDYQRRNNRQSHVSEADPYPTFKEKEQRE